MSKAELDHWLNELISISTISFGALWGQTWIFAITAILAMIFDAQFIIVQRYNRPRVIKILEKEQEIESKKVVETEVKKTADLKVNVNKAYDIINKKK